MSTSGVEVQPSRPSDPVSLGRHRVLGRLGAGGMGVVYLAEGPFGRVAVKLVREELADDPDFRRRFQREVQACFRVGGAHTVRLVDFELDADRPWLATELVDAPSLSTHVRSAGPLGPDEQTVLAAGLADALVSIHAAGMIHRDLKPSNVLWTAHGPKVIDFGIAAAADAAAITLSGQFVGTPGWHAPEQVSGAEATPAADIFAWGALLCFAATGEAPFGTGPGAAVLHRVLAAEPSTDLERIPPGLRRLVTGALAREPADRPTAEALFTELVGSLPDGADGSATRFLQTQPAVAATPPWSATVPPPGARDSSAPGEGDGPAPGRSTSDQARPGSPPSGRPAPPGRTGQGPRKPERRRGRRRLVIALVAAVVVLAAGGTAAALLIGGGDDGASDTVFTADAPWRLRISDEIQGSDDTGCAVTVTDTATGDSRSITDVYGEKIYQVSQVGTFRFGADHPGCVVQGLETAGDASLPFATVPYVGDTEAFRTEGTVTVEVVDFGGSEDCALELHSAADGRLLIFGTARPDSPRITLDAGGPDQVYLAEPPCGLRVLPG
ncbi:serine/threonine-protein kinase [Parafrankia discariae]|uniref:serine/threonine-protein kinase n=1 Tax=Parafrankia discariae TaxID=365528 RepID=UPI00047786A1|nr:serine/threonine-protein kinase [Parafrankia discariae]